MRNRKFTEGSGASLSSKCHECVEQFVEQVHEFVEQVPERYQYLLMCVREGDVGVLSEREREM